MKTLFKSLKNFIGFLRNDDVSLDVKSLYLVIIYSILLNIAYFISFIVYKASDACIYLSAGIILFFALMLYLLISYDEVRLFKIVFIISTNFLIFPLLFFVTGNLNNAAAMFFPLGIVFTFFLIKESWVYVLYFFEICWYAFILSLPLFDPERFSVTDAKLPGNLGIALGFLGAAFAPLFIFIYQSVNYERVRKQLDESRHIIESAGFNKSRFLANVTHEIRTPMNAIIGMNELILREELDPESRELAENIKTSSNQLLKIINNILEFSKLDSNKMELFNVKYDFRDLLSEIINAVSNEYASENTEFIVKVDPNIPRILFGDIIRIKQVFMYLLFSSVHKLPHGRIAMEVGGEVDHATNTVMMNCTIAESGFGLSDHEIEAMLSAYTRYDSRQKSDYKGMGLELSICKEILELMGGTISIKSVVGVGMSVGFEFINYIIEDIPLVRVSTSNDYNILIYTNSSEDQDIWIDVLGQFQLYPNFVNGPNAFRQAIENKRYTHIFIDDIFYPILKETIRSAQITNEVYVLTEAGSVYSDFDNCKILRKPMTCITVANALNNVWDENNYKVAQKREAVIFPEGKVIIVDDSIVNLKVLEGMLQTFEVSITKCKSGAEALDVLETEEFDLIILDQRMPEMDGIELLHLIRKLDNANAMVPILCATADFGPDISRMLANEGFQDYLAKPVRRFYLERMLRKYMPVELAVNIMVEDVETKEVPQKEPEKPEETKDPKDIDFTTGLNNVGGVPAAFASVVNAYYKEGIQKIETVPVLLAEKDIRNYVVEVHALKSSSAAIGAEAMSKLFRELEFAGKADNIDFIESHTGHVIEAFGEVLEVVKQYLIDNGEFEEEDTSVPEGDVEEFDMAVVDELIEFLTNFNIKATEDKVSEICSVNYGPDINEKFRQIKSVLEVFDYHKAKELLGDIKKEEK